MSDVVCILQGGPVYQIDGISFEWNERFGPAVVDKREEILDKQPGPRHRFWKAVTWWAQQGRRLTAEGICIYDEPKPLRLVRLAGRQYVEVPDGQEPEDVRRQWFEKLKVHYSGPLPD